LLLQWALSVGRTAGLLVGLRVDRELRDPKERLQATVEEYPLDGELVMSRLALCGSTFAWCWNAGKQWNAVLRVPTGRQYPVSDADPSPS
jgi:hypothetical protein